MDNNENLADILVNGIGGLSLFFVGIKGTGMSALAELFFNAGAKVSGSDVAQEFYTDKVLNELAIPFVTDFGGKWLPEETDLVIYSPAYRCDENPQLILAQKRGIALLSYTEALGLYSSHFFSCGITGVHGKTTTAALCGSLVKSTLLKGAVLVGSALPMFGNRATYRGGENFFIAETCEYRRHFLHFHPSIILITNIEPDHLDYYKNLDDIELAFLEYCSRLPSGGCLVYCADDPGATKCAQKAFIEGAQSGRDLSLIPYGFQATGGFKIESSQQQPGKSLFKLSLFEETFELKLPGRHLIQNAAGAAALIYQLSQREGLSIDKLLEGLKEGLRAFSGTRRRSEIKGEVGGILVIDDYAHHPTAISVTLSGFRAFYPGRRIIVDFMSHTYSRTSALLTEFGSCFDAADKVYLNKIYASAREQRGDIDGLSLYDEVSSNHSDVVYIPEPLEALKPLLSELKTGDIFITMGAGDNWQLGGALLHSLKERGKS